MGVASGCGEQEVGIGVARGSGWNLWVWLAGGGCGWNLWVWLVGVVVIKEVYRFPHITYPCICSFCSSILLFVHFKIVFRSCSSTFL